MGKIFYAYAVRADAPDGAPDVFLNLPATPYELLDALDALRLDRESRVNFMVDEYYRFSSLAHFLSKPSDLYELNALAQKLSELDDRQAAAFEGLLEIESQILKEAPYGLPDLIDIAYSTGCCHVVDGIENDAELGRFCAENDLVPGTEALPDTVFELLDFEQIGREHRLSEGGVLVERDAEHSGGYVERHSDLVRVYQDLDLTPRAPDYTILLEVSKGFFNDPGYDSGKTAQLKLPATPEALSAALDAVGAWDWREAGWRCLDCRAPQLADAISDNECGIDALNQLAQKLADMEPQALSAYKALLEAAGCRDLGEAEQRIHTLDEYIFSPQLGSPIDVAKGELSIILAEEDAAQLLPCLDLRRYGQALIERCGGMLTEYGLIERKDGQPVQAPEQQPSQGGMEMM